MPPNSALRLKASLPQIGTPTAKISGALLMRFGDPETALYSPDYEDEDSDDDELNDEPREVRIAPLGASLDGQPVPAYEPLTFLDALPLP